MSGGVKTANGSGLGIDRVAEPQGALPQAAERLDPGPPARDGELEIAVERLCLDSTSHRNLRERCGADPGAMAERIMAIVAGRGKMHNPETDSGGILVGRAGPAGPGHPAAPEPGTRIATLGSLTMTPLRLGAVTELDPDSPQVGVEGTAYVFGRASWAEVPDDLPLEAALDVFDVCAAAAQLRELIPANGTVLVLGAGHAGKLAMAAARDLMRDGTVVAADVDPEAIELVRRLGLCDIGVVADLRDPVAALAAIEAAGVTPAQLTVVVVNADRCEATAILLTAERGTVLFFSMATSFGAAALAADGTGSDVRMRIGSGHAPDRGAYALELVRGSAALREALGVPAREAAA